MLLIALDSYNKLPVNNMKLMSKQFKPQSSIKPQQINRTSTEIFTVIVETGRRQMPTFFNVMRLKNRVAPAITSVKTKSKTFHWLQSQFYDENKQKKETKVVSRDILGKLLSLV